MRSRDDCGRRLGLGASLLVATGLCARAGAGDLSPPAGPPAPTMKTLDEVEARTPISTLPGSASATHEITAPGSYYLTADVVGEAGKNGIEALVGGTVTIDLNGFRVRGVAGSETGIVVGGNAVVRNGEVESWDGDGVQIGSGRVEGVHALFNEGVGVRALWGAILTDCLAEVNAGGGFDLGDNCRASGCIAKGNGGPGLDIDGIGVIERCDFYNNECGLTAGGLVIVESCVFHANDGPSNTCDSIRVGSLSIVRGNHVQGGIRGIVLTGNGSRVEGNQVTFCPTGYAIGGVDNMVTGNFAVSCTVGYDIAPGNAPGAVVATPAGAGAWDNFER